MAFRNAPMLEAAEAINQIRETFHEKEMRKQKADAAAVKKLEESVYFGKKEQTRKNIHSYLEFSRIVKEDLLIKALQGITLGALSETVLIEDQHLVITDNLIRGYIKEHGGVDCVLESFKGKTYVLDVIRSLVESEHEEIMDNVDKDNPDTQEVPEDKETSIQDAMDKEDDIHDAVNTIAQRISAAEEEFIRQNAEDKRKIEELTRQVNDRIEAVKQDRDIDDDTTADIEQESTIMFKRKVSAIRHDRNRGVLEQMVRNLGETVFKTESLRENFTTENGKIDMAGIVESATCMYAFLETVNTLKLDRVDESYIENIINHMD